MCYVKHLLVQHDKVSFKELVSLFLLTSYGSKQLQNKVYYLSQLHHHVQHIKILYCNMRRSNCAYKIKVYLIYCSGNKKLTNQPMEFNFKFVNEATPKFFQLGKNFFHKIWTNPLKDQNLKILHTRSLRKVWQNSWKLTRISKYCVITFTKMLDIL